MGAVQVDVFMAVEFISQSKAVNLISTASRPLRVSCMLLVRVVLGDPHFTEGPDKRNPKQRRLPPSRVPPLVGTFNSVVAEPGIRRSDTEKQVHREFVLFDRFQVYPELAIYYRLD